MVSIYHDHLLRIKLHLENITSLIAVFFQKDFISTLNKDKLFSVSSTHGNHTCLSFVSNPNEIRGHIKSEMFF